MTSPVTVPPRDWRAGPPAGDTLLRILIKRGSFADDTRGGRAVPFKLYHPAGGDLPKLPVVVWSHGLGGGADGAAFLSRFIAANGYIVVNMQHPGTDTSLWEGKPGHPWDVIRATPIPRAAVLDRFRDVPFLLDRLLAWMAAQDDMPQPDRDRIGMSGHSFGSLTAQVMAGQGFPDEDGRILSLREHRFRAGILYSPVPVAHMTDAAEEDLYASIALPLLHMTGTEDVSPIEGFGADRRLAVYEHAGHPEQSLVVLREGDHMVFAGSRGKLADSPHRVRHEEIIRIASLAFWDARLNGDEAARRWLEEGGLAAFAGPDAAVSRRAG